MILTLEQVIFYLAERDGDPGDLIEQAHDYLVELQCEIKDLKKEANDLLLQRESVEVFLENLTSQAHTRLEALTVNVFGTGRIATELREWLKDLSEKSRAGCFALEQGRFFNGKLVPDAKP